MITVMFLRFIKLKQNIHPTAYFHKHSINLSTLCDTICILKLCSSPRLAGVILSTRSQSIPFSICEAIFAAAISFLIQLRILAAASLRLSSRLCALARETRALFRRPVRDAQKSRVLQPASRRRYSVIALHPHWLPS